MHSNYTKNLYIGAYMEITKPHENEGNKNEKEYVSSFEDLF